MDVVVTTPKAMMVEAAQEAADCLEAGGGEYFRRFGGRSPNLKAGDRVFYVEDGWLRGYAVVARVERFDRWVECDTTGRMWAPGFYAFMRADSWTWVRPVRWRGFQGWQYLLRDAQGRVGGGNLTDERGIIEEVGGWRDPRPSAPGEAIRAGALAFGAAGEDLAGARNTRGGVGQAGGRTAGAADAGRPQAAPAASAGPGRASGSPGAAGGALGAPLGQRRGSTGEGRP